MKKLMFLSSHNKLGMFSGTPSLRPPTCLALSRINAEMKRPLKP